MPTRTISINEPAYERLKTLKIGNESFSDVILRFFPERKPLSEVLKAIGTDPELADAIKEASETMRQGRMREVEL